MNRGRASWTSGLCESLALAVVVAAAACASKPSAPATGTTMPDSIVEPYVKIHDALAADSVEGVHTAAGEIVTAAAALGAPGMKINTAALKLAAVSEAATPSITTVREQFGTLADEIDAYMTARHLTPPAGVRVAVCPMLKKPWMQKGDAIANPYYGTQMPTCGDFR